MSIPKLDVLNFTWMNREDTLHGVAEISDFKGQELVGQLFDDSADAGFILTDSTPGLFEDRKVEIPMVLQSAGHVGWEFLSLDGSTSIFIFND